MTDITIRKKGKRDDFTDEENDLLDALMLAMGKHLPSTVDRITGGDDGRFDLHLVTNDLGNAYGETLAANGWSIVGFHTHDTQDDTVDRVTVQRTDTCDTDEFLHRVGDEDMVVFQ